MSSQSILIDIVLSFLLIPFFKFFKKDRHFSVDASLNKYIFLQHGNILILYIFVERKNNLIKGFENNT